MYNELTSIDDLSEQIFPPQKIFRRTIPSAIAELVLALGNGQIGAFNQCGQNTRILSYQPSLFTSQCCMDGRIHVHNACCQRRYVIRFAYFCNAPGREMTKKKTNKKVQLGEFNFNWHQ